MTELPAEPSPLRAVLDTNVYVSGTIMDALRTARFIVDAQGNCTGVVLSLEAWETLVSQLEDVEDLKMVRQRWASREERSGWPAPDQLQPSPR
jgi:hypothetical protein